MFIGRKQEKEKLMRTLQRKEQSVCLIYGRRRVGKTELIKHVLGEVDIPSIYFECKET
jgi:AAA+ ATPase superfamily predicted ATPase